MKALLTGGQGFVGTWLGKHLESCGDTVVAPSLEDWDITDAKRTIEVIESSSADVIIHLAALTDVQYSWSHPAEALRLNVIGTQNILQGALAMNTGSRPRVVMVSSAEVYGTVMPEELPITETLPYRPVSPYASTKAAAEMLGFGAWFGSGLEVVIPRSFNHIGPSQAGAFLVAALARRIADAAKGGQTSISVGNLEPKRDFADVRDVVRAYRLLALEGKPGTAYNVCAGVPVSVQEIADLMLKISGASLELVPDPELLRPNDVPVRYGSSARLKADTGWQPEIPLEQTLRDILAEYGLGS